MVKTIIPQVDNWGDMTKMEANRKAEWTRDSKNTHSKLLVHLSWGIFGK